MTAREREKEIRERYERARTMVSNLCAPKHQPEHRDWIMSIPARPDYDPDIVIADSLRDVPRLLDRNERLEKALRDARIEPSSANQ